MDRASRPPRALLVCVLLLAGCGGSGAAHPAAAPPATLPARAVPYLDSQARVLTAAGLAHEAQMPALEGRLAAWGFQAGSARYFQGTSSRLEVVDARTLRFRSARGAEAFIAFARAHPKPFIGAFPTIARLHQGARSGASFVAQPCACHRANPAILGLLAGRRSVSWLEINGPRATMAALRALAARMPA